MSKNQEQLKFGARKPLKDMGKVSQEEPPWWLSSRLWLAICACLGFLLLFTQRVNMSVTIVCMVNHTALTAQTEQTSHDGGNVTSNWTSVAEFENSEGECSVDVDEDKDHIDGPFTWSKSQQGHILGSYFYGYLVSQVPGGLLAERFGGKWVFVCFFSVCTLATLLTPLAATINVGLLVAARVFVGIGAGALYPVMHSIWGHWAPPLERSKLAGITYAGSMMGCLLTMPLSGVLCEHGFAGGWPSVYYISGMMSVVWLAIWVLLVADSPASCRYISRKEKQYIANSLNGQISDKHQPPVPWFSVFRSRPVWAIIIANFTSDWGLYTLLTNIPSYMFEVLKFDIQSNGLYSALPFLGIWINMNLSPVIADKIRSKQLLNTTATRKIFNTIGHMGASVCLIGLSFMSCSHASLAVALLTLGVTLSGSSYTGFLVNHMDLAPQYAGTLLGLTNSLSASSGFIAPYVAAVLTTNKTRSEWQNVFFLASGIYAFGALFYLVFGSGELQSWASEDSKPVVTVVAKENTKAVEAEELMPKEYINA